MERVIAELTHLREAAAEATESFSEDWGDLPRHEQLQLIDAGAALLMLRTARSLEAFAKRVREQRAILMRGK